MTISSEVHRSIEMCRYCFMCRHANPVFLVTKLDAHTPRGYALLLSRIEAGLAEWSDDVSEKVFQSTLDGLCRELCEFHWQEDEVVRTARELAVASGAVPARVREAVDELRARAAVPLPAGSLDGVGVVSDRAGADVLLLTGTIARREAPDLILANAAILAAAGEDWTLLAAEPDCGVALWELGYPADARAAAARLAEAIAALGPREVVCPDPGVCRALRELYPAWGIGAGVGGGARVLHTSEYIAERLASGRLELAPDPGTGPVAYHDPCQLGRRLRVFDPPRAVIAAATGRQPAEFPHARELAECCGDGSSLAVTYPALSRAMAERRLRTLEDPAVTRVVTACPGCRLALAGAAGAAGLDIHVIDIAELVAGRLAVSRARSEELHT
jgi:Fe-S oxidoreductase